MNITVLLADYAQTQDGKLNALGVGWARTSTPLGTHAVILFVDAEETEIGANHILKLRLVDGNGEAVLDPGGGAIAADVDLAVQDPEGVATVAVNLAPGLPLSLGEYIWEVRTAAVPGTVWKRAFKVVDKADVTKASGTTSAQ
ncbi:DUF6941 family protein [Lentzea sp. E54]|uniref:DUF6941 family protein n=1 Tax=Lentzea xerophila TaxID=3435883 RepID=UPI003DA28858